MIPYCCAPVAVREDGVSCFISEVAALSDTDTVESFGGEWEKFSVFDQDELEAVASQYFDILDFHELGNDSNVLDVGCGSARWERILAPKVGFIEAVEPSRAVGVACRQTADLENVRVTQAGVEEVPFPDESFDLVMSLGVLHHIPATADALEKITKKAKLGGKVLIYLYYSFDNRGLLFKALHCASEVLRSVVSTLQDPLKLTACDIIAATVYLPLVSLSRLLRWLSPQSEVYRTVPLSFYVDRSFYIMRNDALDRFGTPLEQRFSRIEIEAMMRRAGLSDIKFSSQEPYWHVVGTRVS